MKKIVFIFWAFLFFHSVALSYEFADFTMQSDGELIDLQNMCKQPSKYAPYILFATSLNQSVFIGFTYKKVPKSLRGYMPKGLSKSISERLIFNTKYSALSRNTFFYIGSIGEYMGAKDQEVSYYYMNVGFHGGFETRFYRKYLSGFIEVGPAFQLRSLLVDRVSESGFGTKKVIGFYGNTGLKYSYPYREDLSWVFRFGLNVDSGANSSVKLTNLDDGSEKTVNANGMFMGIVLDLGIAF